MQQSNCSVAIFSDRVLAKSPSCHPPKVALAVLGPPNDPLNMGTPKFERLFAFHKEFMTLIHSCNAGNRAILMIKDFISYVGRDTEPCHSGYAGPPQIM